MVTSWKIRYALVFACLVTCLALAAQAWSQQAGAENRPGRAGRAATTRPAGQMAEMCKMHMDTMAKLKDTLAQAKQSVLAGKTEQAAQQIDQAQQFIEKQHAAMHEKMQGRMGRGMGGMAGGGMKCPVCGEMMGASGQVSNSECPMDEAKIDPSKMTAAATRDYKGEKIGFCCPGCASQWDQISDAQKQSKIDALAAKEESEPMQGVGER